MTKKDKLQQCKDILTNSEINKPLFGSELEFMIDVFSEHHDIIDTDKEILTFGIIECPIYKNKEFAIRFADGTIRKKISYPKAIKGNPSIESKIKRACRISIGNDILKFKNKNISNGFGICEYTSQKLPSTHLHTDHYNLTFNQLVNFFIYTEGIKNIEKCMNGSNFNSLFTLQFIDFHNKNTNLRLISSELNMIFG